MQYRSVQSMFLLTTMLMSYTSSCQAAENMALQSPAEPKVAFMLPIDSTLNGTSPDNCVVSFVPGPSFQLENPLTETTTAASTLNGAVDINDNAPAAPKTVSEPITADQPAIIDNDNEASESIQTYQWQEVSDSDSKTHIHAGACFPVSIMSEINSQSARSGDPIQGRLKVDIKIGTKVIAKKGAVVNGHVRNVEKARRLLAAEMNPHRWMRASGALGIQFDEIVTDEGLHIPLVATPARRALIVKNKHEGRVLGVNDHGEVTAPLSGQLKAQALHLAIRAGASAGGVFSMGAVPVAFGIVGAVNPSFAFMHPVGQNVSHRRLKGFAMGVTSGLPGGFIIADSIIKGQECVIKPGDEFLAEFKQDFTGEAATEADLLPNAVTKVHGQILSENHPN